MPESAAMEGREDFYERMYEEYTNEVVPRLRQQLRNAEAMRLAFFGQALKERVDVAHTRSLAEGGS